MKHYSEHEKVYLRFFHNGALIMKIICSKWIPVRKEQIIFVNVRYLITEVIYDCINKTYSCYLTKID